MYCARELLIVYCLFCSAPRCAASRTVLVWRAVLLVLFCAVLCCFSYPGFCLPAGDAPLTYALVSPLPLRCIAGFTSSDNTSDADDDEEELAKKLLLIDQNKPRWQRAADEPCYLPIAMQQRLPASEMGCFTLAFSHTGLWLAAGCSNQGKIKQKSI